MRGCSGYLCAGRSRCVSMHKQYFCISLLFVIVCTDSSLIHLKRNERRLLQASTIPTCTVISGQCGCSVLSQYSSVSASSSYSPHLPVHAIDGNMGTVWHSNTATGDHWWRLSFASIVSFSGGILQDKIEPARMKNFEIWVGNDTSFPGTNQLCYTSSNAGPFTNGVLFYEAFSCALAGSNLFVARRSSTNYFQIDEAQFYKSSGISGQEVSNGVCLCANGTGLINGACVQCPVGTNSINGLCTITPYAMTCPSKASNVKYSILSGQKQVEFNSLSAVKPNIASNFQVALTVKLLAPPGSGFGEVIKFSTAVGDCCTYQQRIMVLHFQGSSPRFSSGGGDYNTDFTVTMNPINIKQIYSFVFVIDEWTTKIYIDGILLNTISDPKPYRSPQSNVNVWTRGDLVAYSTVNATVGDISLYTCQCTTGY